MTTRLLARPSRGRTPAPARSVIIHIIDELKVGGAQTHLLTMLREAIVSHPKLEHRVISLFGDGEIGDSIRREGISVESLDLRPYFAQRRFVSAARVLEQIFREHRPDVVEAHLTWSRLLGLYAAWRAGIPRRIAFEHGDIYLDSWKFRAANRVCQIFADRIVVCSQALADWNRRTNGISRQRQAVLHNCVDIDRFRPRNEAAHIERRKFDLPPEVTLFGAVGTLGRGVNKRVDVAIRAVAEARSRGGDVALVVCGDGDQRGELETLADTLGVARWVRFLGTRHDIPEILSDCDAFCHAAPFEPFGIVCIEAMAVGLPVVVPGSGGIREAVQDGVTGLIYPALDHEALASAMLRLHDSPDLRRPMGLAARRAAEDHFSVGRYVRWLYAMYGYEPEDNR